MSSNDKILHCVLKKQWFEKIKSGEKTHEYREYKYYWIERIGLVKIGKGEFINFYNPTKVRFSLGMTTEPEKTMLFKIRDINIVDGKNTDLAIDKLVYDIELGKRL